MAVDLKINTLIVENSAANRKSIKNMLKTIGLSIISEAPTCQEALTAIAQQQNDKNPIEFIILSYAQTDGDGITLTAKIREISKAKILMTTPEPDPERVLNGLKAGVNSVIVFPFSAVDLNAKIKQIFK